MRSDIAPGGTFPDYGAVTREIRPDWDLSTPGLRDAWGAGDPLRFHGWNERGPASPSAA